MKSALLALFILISANTFAQYKYTIQGSVKGMRDTIEKVYLSYRVGDDVKRDSSTVKNGKYSFQGTRDEISLVTVRAYYKTPKPVSQKRDLTYILMGGGNIKIQHTDSFANVKVSGSKEHLEYLAMQEKLKPTEAELQKKTEEYIAFRNKKDNEGMNRVEKEMEVIEGQQKLIYKDLFLANPNSVLAMSQLQYIAGWDVNADEVEPLFNMLPSSTKNSRSGKLMAEKIEIAKKLGIGKVAPDFTQNDTLGNPVTLSSLRGKYVLVDFWASWCGPCRRENPNVVKAFQKFKDKGFHIIGVSLDQPNAKDKWIKAIHDDQLTWTQVSDLQFWKNAVAVEYGIQAIPQNYLLDPEGKIIAKNLSGDDLDKKLEEVMK
jgi:peroxiredoxin